MKFIAILAYSWVLKKDENCSKSCGGGIRKVEVYCENGANEKVSSEFCNSKMEEKIQTHPCNTEPCRKIFFCLF